ncbi:hypothetical protein ACM66B_000565 [Microbotryomycetes sp. NB124-2]
MASFDTVYSACSIECEPAARSTAALTSLSGSATNARLESRLCAVGTYQIFQNGRMVVPPSYKTGSNEQEQEQDGEARAQSDEIESGQDESPVVERKGRLYLARLRVPDVDEGQDPEREDDRVELSIMHQTDTDAILDMKWQVSNFAVFWGMQADRAKDDRSSALIGGNKILAVADSKGKVSLNKLNQDRLEILQSIRCADEDTLCLSLDWSNRGLFNQESASIVVSLSNGSICTLDPSSSSSSLSDYKVTRRWHAHDFEPWIAAYDCWSPNTVWTGGDDLKLKRWDIRTIGGGSDSDDVDRDASPVAVNKRFDGGVTTFQSHPTREHVLAVGSYDAQVRIFDTRKLTTPVSSFDAGGGIWRLKWHDVLPERVLVAAMHDGFKVVDVPWLAVNVGTDVGPEAVQGKDMELVTRFDGHGSLAYGVDWSHGLKDRRGRDIVASCSFYDHLMHVWSV